MISFKSVSLDINKIRIFSDGLVSLPGMMTGQILGGSIPMVAIKYQIAIMVCIFYTEYFSVILSILFSLKTGFNAFDVLKSGIFRSNGK